MKDLEAGDKSMALTDDHGKPLHLFLLDGRPVTDSKGVPLLNITGNPVISTCHSKGITHYQDWKGCPLTDWKGRTYENKGYCPTQVLDSPAPNVKCECQVFSSDGLPLSDTDGVPLLNIQGKPLIIFNPKGRPVMDLQGKDITDRCGRVLYANEKPLLSKGKLPLRVYDEMGRPLTDDNGFPFTNILGWPLIITDENRNPIKTSKGHPISDSNGSKQWDTGYDLTKPPKYYIMHKAIICKNNERGIAFDTYGHPLTDMYGFPLFTLEGDPLVKKKKIWVDINMNPAIIISKSCYDNGTVTKLQNSHRLPVRLFDKRGYPLTDHEGAPMTHASGPLLLKFNESGEPVSDWNDETVYDALGYPLGSQLFSPCREFGRNYELVANHKGYCVQFFDVAGMPLTNRRGVPLLNKYQELMVILDSNYLPERDLKGREIYDILGLPVVKSFIKPLLGPNGEPIRLYNKSGRPLTDRDGNILRSLSNEPLLKLNNLGQIVSDFRGGPLFDCNGTPMSLIDKFLTNNCRKNDMFNKILLTLQGKPLIMYDISGEPLTDSRGGILTDRNGKPLITSSISGVITERNGQLAYDSEGYTVVKIAGRATAKLFAVYDRYDRPLIGPSGYILRLRNGREMLKLDKCGLPISTYDGKRVYDQKGYPVFTPLSDISIIPSFEKKVVFNGKLQLFDCEERPLLDITGVLLHTSKGVPLIQFNRCNEPRSDYIGRPIYDERGIPICNPGGIWKDEWGRPYRLYDSENLPLTDPRGKELLDITGNSLLKKDEYGHPAFDKSRNWVRDANGHFFCDQNFLGTVMPPESQKRALMESTNKPLRIYDLDGRPLTDECGKPLETIDGTPLVNTNSGLNKITDFRERTVFDYRRIPLGCDSTTPILTMDGKPMILYNMEGNALMSLDGLAILHPDGTPVISFDEFGRPWKCGKSGLFDSCGISIDSAECSLAHSPSQLMPVEGKHSSTCNSECHEDIYRTISFIKAGSWGDNPG